MRIWVCLLAVCAALAAPAAFAQTGNSFAVRNVRVFDGERTIAHANVVVRDGRIAAIGRNARIPGDFEVIDGAGKTLLPGLIDAHVHVFPGAQADALRFGVTTELDMFNLNHDFAKWRAQRESLAQTSEADAWSAGTGVSAPGGHPNQFVPPDMPRLVGAENARAFVDARVAEGSDYVKIMMENGSTLDPTHTIPTLSRDEVCTAIAAAHADRKMAIGHITRADDADMASGCGIDGLAHIFVDRVADPALVRRLRARGSFFITTLAVEAGVSNAPYAQALAARADVAPFLSAGQRRSLAAPWANPHPAQIDNALQTVRLLNRAGVRLLAGTDAPGPGTAHGVSIHEELQLLVRASLGPQQALRAATATPAAVFGLADRGRIRAGLRADLVLVRGDPTREIEQTLAIDRIWKNGYTIDRTPPAPQLPVSAAKPG